MSNTILGADGNATVKPVPNVVGVNPCGSQILVELLTAQEALGTVIHVDSSAAVNGAPQGYILAIGPKAPTDMGFAAGDRVTLNGNYTPIPEGQRFQRKNPHRPWILVEPHQIKAVFVED